VTRRNNFKCRYIIDDDGERIELTINDETFIFQPQEIRLLAEDIVSILRWPLSKL
jgi:hypothetical protein